ncbi:MAG: hypothetical protein ABI702_15045 [Burkholderiales bacterium]
MQSGRPHHASYDELQLAGLVLRAMEAGSLRMDAADYLAVALQAGELLDQYETDFLLMFRRQGPKALREIAENLLDMRGAFDGHAHDPVRQRAAFMSEILIARLMASRGSLGRR